MTARPSPTPRSIRAVVRAGLVLAGLVAWLVAIGSPAGAQTGVEHISSYIVNMRIEHDGLLTVTERIDYDFGTGEHHGIFRDIPVRFAYNDRFDRVYPLHVVSVTATGASAKYSTEHDGNLLRIKIGDPKRTVTGRHIYTIVYTVEGAMNGFRDHDELYWNAVGQYWPVSIDRATAKVTGPATFTQVTCFSGGYGSNLPCSESSLSGPTATFTQDSLSPYEGLTVVVGLPKGAVPQPHPILKERWAFQRAFSLTPVTVGASGALLLLLLGGVGWLLWVNGRDRRAVGSPIDIAYGTTSGGEQAVPLFERSDYPVEYAPPEDIRPGQVGTLIDEVANPLDVTATIVDLAVRGYLRIEEIPKEGWFGKPDWRLVKLKESDDSLLVYERRLFDGMFAGADIDEETALDEMAMPPRPDTGTMTGTDLGSVRLSALKLKFYKQLHEVQDSLYADAVERKWFAARPDKVRSTWASRGWFLLIVGGVLTFLVAAKTHLGLIPVPLVLGGLVLIRGATNMPRRTPKGTGMVRRVFGFRTYIETAEAQEARFQERENIFSKYLPYAVVFGLTEKWARAFAKLGDQPPDTSGWYIGAHPFTIYGFSSAMDGFAVTAAGTIASTPSSSGSSGFGGGGFSGGGGGGGGGGSW